MKNLKNYDVQELNIKEMTETEGGIIPILIGIAVILTATNCGGAPGCAAAKPVYEQR